MMNGKLLNRSFLTRTLSGVAFVVIVTGAVLCSSWTFAALLAVVCGGCLWEFYRLAAAAGAEPQRWLGTTIGIVLVICGCLGWKVDVVVLSVILLAFIPLAFSIFVVELYRKREQPLLNVATTLTGIVYVAVPLLLFWFMAHSTDYDSGWMALAYLGVVWANDTGAYLVGVSFGKHPLFARISPKKSWEGFFGGIVAAVGVALLAGHWMAFAGTDLLIWGGLGLVIAVSGVWGDLVESMFKRSVGMKDSGAIMPGHGGFLDRFDALLLSLPFAAFYYFICLHLF